VLSVLDFGARPDAENNHAAIAAAMAACASRGGCTLVFPQHLATPPPPSTGGRSCPHIDERVCYTNGDGTYLQLPNVTDASGCCAACHRDSRTCVAFTQLLAPEFKPSCHLKRSRPTPSQKKPDSSCTSGEVAATAAGTVYRTSSFALCSHLTLLVPAGVTLQATETDRANGACWPVLPWLESPSMPCNDCPCRLICHRVMLLRSFLILHTLTAKCAVIVGSIRHG
jgi:hypothetical protein